jgi:hypothetical protein
MDHPFPVTHAFAKSFELDPSVLFEGINEYLRFQERTSHLIVEKVPKLGLATDISIRERRGKPFRNETVRPLEFSGFYSGAQITSFPFFHRLSLFSLWSLFQLVDHFPYCPGVFVTPTALPHREKESRKDTHKFFFQDLQEKYGKREWKPSFPPQFFEFLL